MGEVAGDADAQAPRGRAREGSSTPPSIPTQVESQRVAALQAPQQQRGVGDVAGQRPALVERGGEGDHPVAGDRPVGRLQARRSRTATRAGGSSRRCRSRSPTARGARRRRPPSRPRSRPGPARGPRGCAPARRRSSRSRSPSRTRPCSSCRARARRRRRGARPRSPCRAGGSPRGCASPRWSSMPSVQKMSLTATGMPAQRLAARCRRRPASAPPQVGAELVAGGGLGVGVEVLVGVQLAGLDPPERLGRGELEQLAHSTRPAGEGTRKAPSAGSGAGSSARSRGRLGRGSSAAGRSRARPRAWSARRSSRSSARDPLDVLEDRRELARHALDLRRRRARAAPAARRGGPARDRSRRCESSACSDRIAAP